MGGPFAKQPPVLCCSLFTRSRGALVSLFAKTMQGALSIWPPLLGICDGKARAGYATPLLQRQGVTRWPRRIHQPRPSMVPGHVKNYSPGYIEQAPSRGHGASPQSLLGVGWKLFSRSKILRWLSVRAQARRISTSPSFSLLRGFLWMVTWIAMVSSRDRPQEGARGAQRTYRGAQRALTGEARRRGVAGRSLALFSLL